MEQRDKFAIFKTFKTSWLAKLGIILNLNFGLNGERILSVTKNFSLVFSMIHSSDTVHFKKNMLTIIMANIKTMRLEFLNNMLENFHGLKSLFQAFVENMHLNG